MVPWDRSRGGVNNGIGLPRRQLFLIYWTVNIFHYLEFVIVKTNTGRPPKVCTYFFRENFSIKSIKIIINQLIQIRTQVILKTERLCDLSEILVTIAKTENLTNFNIPNITQYIRQNSFQILRQLLFFFLNTFN